MLLLATQGCGVHTVNEEPQPAKPGKTGFVNHQAPSGSRGNHGDRWWKRFRDSNLDGLIEAALAENPDLQAVSRRIDQANARLVQAGATLFPQIGFGGDFESRWDEGGSRVDGSSLGLTFDWELDVWGRIRSGRSAREKEAEAAAADWETARLLLTASVAETWYELIEQRGQLRLAGEQLDVNRTLLELTRLRAGQGQGSAVAVLQQQEQLQSIETRVPDIEARIEALELTLDALIGSLPGSRKRVSGTDELRSPPPLPKTGLASDLLADRPDLRARRARVIALDHEVGEAIADRLPRFSIGGSLGAGGSPGLDRLIGDAIAGAVAPVFEAGSRKAEVSRRQSRVQEELDLYTGDFIAAVRDVETALSNAAKLAERVRRQSVQLDTARKLLAESRNRYTQAVTDYLPVLDAVSKVQQLERDLLTSRREWLSAHVALHRALGGPMPEKP